VPCGAGISESEHVNVRRCLVHSSLEGQSCTTSKIVCYFETCSPDAPLKLPFFHPSSEPGLSESSLRYPSSSEVERVSAEIRS